MSDVVTNVSRFVSLVMAQIKGDTDTVIALKNEKKVKSAINGQINALERSIEDQKDLIETRTTEFNAVFAPATLITSSAQSYIDRLAEAQDALTEAQDDLTDLEASLETYKGYLKEFEVPTV